MKDLLVNKTIKILVYFLFLWIGKFASAQDLKLVLNVEQSEMSVGIPIIISVTIKSEKDFTLHGPFNLCDGHTGLIIRDRNGNSVSPIVEMGCAFPEMSPFDSETKAKYEKFASTNFEFFLNPGRYGIRANYVSRGPYLDRYSETDQRPVEGIWVGELSSNEVKFTVKNPEGEDQKAFIALRPSQEELPPPENELPWFLKIKGKEILQRLSQNRITPHGYCGKEVKMSYTNLMNSDKFLLERSLIILL